MSANLCVVAQKAVIKEGDRYLLMKRSSETRSYQGCWEFPGGRLERGENILKSVEREVFEETSLKVKAMKPVFAWHSIINDEPIVFIFHFCKKVSGKVRLSDEHTEFRWLRKSEIQRLEATPALRAFIEKGLRREVARSV